MERIIHAARAVSPRRTSRYFFALLLPLVLCSAALLESKSVAAPLQSTFDETLVTVDGRHTTYDAITADTPFQWIVDTVDEHQASARDEVIDMVALARDLRTDFATVTYAVTPTLYRIIEVGGEYMIVCEDEVVLTVDDRGLAEPVTVRQSRRMAL